ncbi:dammarenediol 12-hydroxylase-like [Lycium barbarum]|uniref:dammarenediol 12-hydroxylase-like n=1 Tax=Lycium barbarum TaxID=112863 RepID=UPI00293F4319|nr:dammarenediol 12-hydroxylase-like [Lycium barbarum]
MSGSLETIVVASIKLVFRVVAFSCSQSSDPRSDSVDQFSLLLTVFSFLVFYTISLKKKAATFKTRKQLPLRQGAVSDLPPGSFCWPLVGETLDYLSDVKNGSLVKFLTQRRSKYSSKIFSTALIGHPMVFLSGADGNKFLFSNENKLTHQKANHKDFASTRKLLSAPLRSESLQRFISIPDAILRCHLQTDWNCPQIKVLPAVRKYIFSLACKLFRSIDDTNKVERLSKYMEDISTGLLSMPINLPGTTFNRAVRASKEMRKEATNEQEQFLNESDIASNIVGLLQGGYSTANAAITIIMKYMAEYPKVYSEVLKEQMEIANSKTANDLLNWEDLRKMSYSWNVASEVLRLAPPVHGTFREAIEDIRYDGYTIPKGWKMTPIKTQTTFRIHIKFDPMRFQGNGPAPYTFVPFGGGPRMCPGNEYFRMVALVFMHNVVTKFRWEKVIPDEKLVSAPTPRPAQGLPVRLYPHKT